MSNGQDNKNKFGKKSQKPVVLTIAGFDPSSGAGLTADIRTFENIGVYGMAVCTAITIQNAQNVQEWKPIEPELVREQLEILLNSYDIKVVKTGMLATPEIVVIVAEFQKKFGFDLVVDPVIFSGSGMKLGTSDIENALKTILFPLATVITPNRYEAEFFSGKKITDVMSVQDICTELYSLGPKNVIVKGGHINESEKNIMDYLYTDGTFRFYPRERADLKEGEHIHGTGCVFSSLIAGFLALGYDIEESIFFSEDFMERIFEKTFPLKNGTVLDPGHTQQEIDVLLAVQKVVDFICGNPDFTRFVPEVRMNVSISKRDATELKDIAAVDGRITVVSGLPVAAGPIKFGASNHTGRLLLEAKKFDKGINVVMNVKYQPETILKLKNTTMLMIKIDRTEQEKEISETENSSMGWIIRKTFEKTNRIPDIIWDSGEPEKEPMIRLFAKDAQDLIQKLKLFINLT